MGNGGEGRKKPEQSTRGTGRNLPPPNSQRRLPRPGEEGVAPPPGSHAEVAPPDCFGVENVLFGAVFTLPDGKSLQKGLI